MRYVKKKSGWCYNPKQSARGGPLQNDWHSLSPSLAHHQLLRPTFIAAKPGVSTINTSVQVA